MAETMRAMGVAVPCDTNQRRDATTDPHASLSAPAVRPNLVPDFVPVLVPVVPVSVDCKSAPERLG